MQIWATRPSLAFDCVSREHGVLKAAPSCAPPAAPRSAHSDQTGGRTSRPLQPQHGPFRPDWMTVTQTSKAARRVPWRRTTAQDRRPSPARRTRRLDLCSRAQAAAVICGSRGATRVVRSGTSGPRGDGCCTPLRSCTHRVLSLWAPINPLACRAVLKRRVSVVGEPSRGCLGHIGKSGALLIACHQARTIESWESDTPTMRSWGNMLQTQAIPKPSWEKG